MRANHKGGYRGELKRGLQMRTVVCVFLLHGREVARGSSLRILDVEIAELSSLQIRCPIPDYLHLQPPSSGAASSYPWDSMRLERRLSPHPEHREAHLSNSTLPFPVCNMHRLEAVRAPSYRCTSNRSACFPVTARKPTPQKYTPSSKQTQTLVQTQVQSQYLYKLSLCTATSRASRPQLVEWIEYHR